MTDKINVINYNELKLKKNDLKKQIYKLKEELKVLNNIFNQQSKKEKINEYSKNLMRNKYHNDEEFKERRKQRALEYYYEKKKEKELNKDLN